MRSEQPSSTPDDAASVAHRVLRRRVEERVISGVASGLGEFLNVDPLLIRVAFVGLMVFGGLGLLLYVGAWLIIPDETTDESILGQVLDRSGLTASRLLVGLLFIAAGLLFLAGMNSMAGTGFAVAFGVALVVIVMGVVLFRQGPQRSVALPPAPVPVARETRRLKAAEGAVADDAAWRRARRRARSPLGWYILGAMFVAVGGLALATNVTGADVELGQYFGIALGTLGVGLVVGTWWGSARALILLGILLLPFAVASGFVVAPIEGGVGDVAYRPANAGEIQEEYRLLGGRMVVDLTALAAADGPIEIAASVAVGQMRVVLPDDASVEVVAGVGAGELGMLGAWQEGTGLSDRYIRDGAGARFVLHLDAGIGSLWVDGAPAASGR